MKSRIEDMASLITWQKASSEKVLIRMLLMGNQIILTMQVRGVKVTAWMFGSILTSSITVCYSSLSSIQKTTPSCEITIIGLPFFFNRVTQPQTYHSKGKYKSFSDPSYSTMLTTFSSHCTLQVVQISDHPTILHQKIKQTLNSLQRPAISCTFTMLYVSV